LDAEPFQRVVILCALMVCRLEREGGAGFSGALSRGAPPEPPCGAGGWVLYADLC